MAGIFRTQEARMGAISEIRAQVERLELLGPAATFDDLECSSAIVRFHAATLKAVANELRFRRLAERDAHLSPTSRIRLPRAQDYENFQALPDWLKHAYHNDGAVNRVVKEWRMTSKPLASLYESLAEKMYELKNHWQAPAEYHASRAPVVIAMPSENNKVSHE